MEQKWNGLPTYKWNRKYEIIISCKRRRKGPKDSPQLPNDCNNTVIAVINPAQSIYLSNALSADPAAERDVGQLHYSTHCGNVAN